MVALAHQDSRRHLRLVSADELARRQRGELALMRRRALAVGLVVALLLGLGVLLGRTGHAAAGAGGADGVGRAVRSVPSVGVDAATLPVATRAYVVQSGDTLWRIARALQPDGDVRPLVSQLERARHGAPLRVGERIVLP
ncbi:MAG TPA: LysM peptidoglycan-binding domain-containing protein [Acidimicrobiales bacterium]|jgi:hypothetical protein|nr:LysM peptidoglycan-binding domain-containing protein [Acidimicrobiales bacterium]